MNKDRDPKDWLPDWKDKGQYPSPKETSYSHYAWEFLRRNLDYQKDYEELGYPKGHICLEGKAFCETCRNHPNSKYEVNHQHKPERYYRALSKWGVLDLTPPSHPHLALNFLIDHMPYIWVGGKEVRLTNDPKMPYFFVPKEGEILAILNVGMNLSDQIDKIETVFKETKSNLNIKKTVPDKDDFPVFLRILDATYFGCSPREIEPIIYPDKNYGKYGAREKYLGTQVGGLLKSAESYRDSKYRSLPPYDVMKNKNQLITNYPRHLDDIEKLAEMAKKRGNY